MNNFNPNDIINMFNEQKAWIGFYPNANAVIKDLELYTHEIEKLSKYQGKLVEGKNIYLRSGEMYKNANLDFIDGYCKGVDHTMDKFKGAFDKHNGLSLKSSLIKDILKR